MGSSCNVIDLTSACSDTEVHCDPSFSIEKSTQSTVSTPSHNNSTIYEYDFFDEKDYSAMDYNEFTEEFSIPAFECQEGCDEMELDIPEVEKDYSINDFPFEENSNFACFVDTD